MRYVELFAGAGGLSLGFERAGWTCEARAEIEPHARAVLRQQWPDVALHGDVTRVDWTPYAGRVDAVIGGSPCQDLSVAGKRQGLAGARSGLFWELVRVWEETRAPLLVWENVDGARSSNAGADFATVLGAVTGSTVDVPRVGRRAKWARAGRAVGATGVAAWRVLDVQYFGPPQRRRRVFVVAVRSVGAPGVDPVEVLVERSGVCGHPPPRRGAQHDDAGRATRGAALGDRSRVAANNPLPFTTTQTPKVGGAVTHTLEAASRSGGGQTLAVLAFHHKQDPISSDVCPALGINNDGMGVLEPVVGVDIAPTLGARDYKGPGNYYDGSLQATVFPHGRPRRLLPIECERLMGWPDEWTARGVNEHGRRYTLTDTARYRLTGNGVGAPVAEWIARRLLRASRAHTTVAA